MATRQATPDDFAAIKALAKEWGKIIGRHAYGQSGPGLDVDFDQMEQIAAAAAAGLCEGAIEHLTRQQAQRLPETLPCPTCQQPCSLTRKPRSVVARGATVTLDEPVAHCPACRRDFFPPANPPPT